MATTVHKQDYDWPLVRLHLDQIPKHSRDVLTLRLRDGLSYVGISRQLGVPMGTVQSRLARARKMIRARSVRPVRQAVARQHLDPRDGGVTGIEVTTADMASE